MKQNVRFPSVLVVMDLALETSALKAEARRLGFAFAGASPAVEPGGIGRFNDWLAAGYAGEMHYLADRAAAYSHPRHVLADVRSVMMLAMPYTPHAPRPSQPSEGRVARYASGSVDYHDLIHERLRSLSQFLQTRIPEAKVRGVVDSAPLLEREFAQLAGIGWIGKNTLLLNKTAGSYFLLAALLTDVELQYDPPHDADHCGTCRACLDICPTDAFPAPYVLDASRCISYLTIEHRGPIPADLRAGIGDWLFGCDLCQEVCPWNRHAPETNEPELAPVEGMNPLDVCDLFQLDDEGFRQRFRHTPLWRSKRRGLLRNAAIVLGNTRPPQGFDLLVRGLADEEPLVRGACAWALGQYDDIRAQQALVERRDHENDREVRGEIEAALGATGARLTSDD